MEINNYKIIKTGTFYFDSKYIYDMHCHKHLEIICVLSGQCLLSINGRDVALKSGDCIALSENCNHNFFVNGINGCKINQLEVENLPIKFKADYYSIGNSEIINNCLGNIYEYQHNNIYSSCSDAIICNELNKLQILLNALSKEDKQLPPTELSLASRLVGYIKEHCNEDINFENLATTFGISSRYFRRLIMNKIGISAVDYLTNLRLEQSKRLLVFSDMHVTDIALESGYNTVQYFTQIFKERIGLTPSVFRKLNKRA